jgi:tetratricopeptide (TPR) repeat protein
MLKKFFHWLLKLFQRVLSFLRTSTPSTPTSAPQPLKDSEYEHYFMQLLDGVHRGWGESDILHFFETHHNRITPQDWIIWLHRFQQEVVNAATPNRELAHRLIALQQKTRLSPSILEIGQLAGDIGTKLLEREVPGRNEVAEAIDPPADPEPTPEAPKTPIPPKVASEGDPGTWFELGVSKLDAEDYEGALYAFNQVIELDNEDHRAWTNRGNALLNLGRLEEAVASYDRAIAINPEAQSAYCNRGDALFDLSRWEEAIASWDKSLQTRPDDAETWYNRGLAYSRGLGQWQAAIASWDQALALNPDDPETWFNYGIAKAGLNLWQEAINCWDKALALNPDLPDAWINKGVAYQKLGRYQEAIAANNQAIAISGRLSAPPAPAGASDQEAADLYNKGVEQYYAGQIENALALFNRALNLQPNYYDAWNGKGNILRDLGEVEQALACYDKALAIQPNYHFAWNGKGVTLFSLDRTEEALACLNHALELDPNYHHAWNVKGSVLRKLNQTAGALRCYEKALEIQPNFLAAWNNRGNILRELNRLEEALACFEQALALDAKESAAWYGKGNVLSDLHRYQEALQCYNQALELHPEDALSWTAKGNILKELGEWEAAIASYERGIHFQPADPMAWYDRGVALQQLQRDEEAVSSYEKALQLSKGQVGVAWVNLGILRCKLQGYSAGLSLWEKGLEILQPTGNQEALALLHWKQGQAYYAMGKAKVDPYPNWREAKKSIMAALGFLEAEQSPFLFLEVLQDLAVVCFALGRPMEGQELTQAGLEMTPSLLAKLTSQESQRQFFSQLSNLYQLQVDSLARSDDPQQHIAALELAQTLEYWHSTTSQKPTYLEIQQGLVDNTMAVYWHLSPVVLTVFMIPDQGMPVILGMPVSDCLSVAEAEEAVVPLSRRWDQVKEQVGKLEQSELPAPIQIHKIKTLVQQWSQNSQSDSSEALQQLAQVLRVEEILQMTGECRLVVLPHWKLQGVPVELLIKK